MKQRKQIRLKKYDYSLGGAYFVTICTENRKKILGSIQCRGDPCGRPITKYTLLGEIANNSIKIIEKMYNVDIDKYVIMPNHIHMILGINDRATARVAPTLNEIIGAYKSIISNEYMKECNKNSIIIGKLWQRSFYDHIIRNEKEYQEIWKYIDYNPTQWTLDKYYN